MSLRTAFRVNSLSTCGKALRILWADGVESTFPSTWLRASVRNSPYFDDVATMYGFDHLSFLQKTSAIASVENKTAESTSRSVSSPLRYETGGVAPRRYLERKEISIPTLHGLVHVVINLIPRLSLALFPGLPHFYLELLWKN